MLLFLCFLLLHVLLICYVMSVFDFDLNNFVLTHLLNNLGFSLCCIVPFKSLIQIPGQWLPCIANVAECVDEAYEVVIIRFRGSNAKPRK
ncbi:hypothetical protein QVD17_31257 [Tagetes erecta]|uniref:Secreted protein n=1 Tax=Tagetes erecta TaxID=13708 RepID=A0AAD8K325_TARER|nr:hypothetical protein QVD17_31257 [Tagetes erecta]